MLLVSWCVCAGDSGEGEEPSDGELVKESDETFVIWCSGRVHCAGMLVHMEVPHTCVGVYSGCDVEVYSEYGVGGCTIVWGV